VVASNLLDLLHLVETQPNRWTEADFKQNLMQRLERTARCLEQDLPSLFRSGDGMTDAWLKRTGREMAAALREKKKWILAPNPGSRERFLETLKDDLVSAATGNWDGFERMDPGNFSRRQFFYRLGDFLQTLLLGALPLLILWFLQQTPLALGDAAADTARLVALGWLVLSLLFRVDPLSKDKLASLEKVKGFFPFK
jgi:hypothetical protein